MGGRRKARLAVPAAAALAWLTAGCVYVPTFGIGQPCQIDLERVGDATSSEPVRPGVQRAAVVKVLGEPDLISADGLTVAYVDRSTAAYWIGVIPPLFFHYVAHESGRGLKLIFGTDQTLDHTCVREVVATNSFFAPLGPGGESRVSPGLISDRLNAGAPAAERLYERSELPGPNSAGLAGAVTGPLTLTPATRP